MKIHNILSSARKKNKDKLRLTTCVVAIDFRSLHDRHLLFYTRKHIVNHTLRVRFYSPHIDMNALIYASAFSFDVFSFALLFSAYKILECPKQTDCF